MPDDIVPQIWPEDQEDLPQPVIDSHYKVVAYLRKIEKTIGREYTTILLEGFYPELQHRVLTGFWSAEVGA